MVTIAMTPVEELWRYEQQLLGRLHDGEQKIAQARARGQPVAAWEDLWIKLLHEYEQTHDALRATEGA